MRRIPDFARTTSLVARALRLTPAQLRASFRPARQDDLERVIQLRRSEFKDIDWDDHAYLSWRYRFGRTDRGRGECWMLERGTDLLGIVGSEEIELDGVCGRCRAVLLMDILVHEDARGIALGPWMNMALMAQYECVAVLGSNAHSNGMVSTQFAEQRFLRNYTHYLRCDSVIRRRLDIPIVTQLIAHAGNLALRCWNTLHKYRRSPVIVRELQGFDELESLLAQWRPTKGHVGRVRSRDFLDWRVSRNPRARYEITGAWHRGRPCGYLIAQVSTSSGRRELRLVDWLIAPGDDGSALRSLIARAIDRAAAEALDVVTACLLHDESEALLRKSGFILRPRDRIPFVYQCRSPHPLLRHTSAPWCLTRLDGDLD